MEQDDTESEEEEEVIIQEPKAIVAKKVHSNFVVNAFGTQENSFNMLFGHFENCDAIQNYIPFGGCSRYPYCPHSHLEYFNVNSIPWYDNNFNRLRAFQSSLENNKRPFISVKSLLRGSQSVPPLDAAGNLVSNNFATNKDQPQYFFKILSFKDNKKRGKEEDNLGESPTKKKKIEEIKDINAYPIAFEQKLDNVESDLENPLFDKDFNECFSEEYDMGIYEFSCVQDFGVEGYNLKNEPEIFIPSSLEDKNFIVINRICNHNLFYVEQNMLDNEYFRMDADKVGDSMKSFVECLLSHYEKLKNTKNNHKNKYEFLYELANGNVRYEHILNQWANQNMNFLLDNLATLKNHPTLIDHPDEIDYSKVSFSWKDVCIRKHIDPDYGNEKEIAKILFLWVCYYANVEYKSYRSFLFTRVLHNLVNYHFSQKYALRPEGIIIRHKWLLQNKIENIFALERQMPAFMGSEVYSTKFRQIGSLN